MIIYDEDCCVVFSKPNININSLKESIINDMRLTYNHAYGIDFSSYDEKSLELFGLSNEDKQGIYRQMKQIFENCIEPKMTYKI